MDAGRQRRGIDRRDDHRAAGLPQLAVFFEKFPRLKAAITDVFPAGVRRCAVG